MEDQERAVTWRPAGHRHRAAVHCLGLFQGGYPADRSGEQHIDRRESIARFEAKAERKFEQIDSKLDRLLEAVLYNHSQNVNGLRK